MSLIFWGSQSQRQQDSQQAHSGFKAKRRTLVVLPRGQGTRLGRMRPEWVLSPLINPEVTLTLRKPLCPSASVFHNVIDIILWSMPFCKVFWGLLRKSMKEMVDKQYHYSPRDLSWMIRNKTALGRWKSESSQLGFKTTVPDTDDICNSVCNPLPSPFPQRKDTQLPHSALFPFCITRQWQRRRKAEPERKTNSTSV